MPHPGAITNLVQMTTFVPTFRVYRGIDNIFDNSQNPNTWRASATYVTGAHNMKVGYQGAYHIEETTDFANDARYTLTDLGFIAPGLVLGHHPHRAVAEEQSHGISRGLRAGPVDHRPRDAAGRAALRSRLELVSCRAQRCP